MIKDLKEFFITDSVIINTNIVDEVNGVLSKGDGDIKRIKYIDKSSFGLVLKNKIAPVKIFSRDGRVYIVKNSDAIRPEALIGYIVFMMDSNKNFNCKIYQDENKAVAHHANVQRDTGNLCLGDISGSNNITKINFETLQILLRCHNYGSPHNSDLTYVFNKDTSVMLSNGDIVEYTGSLRI